MKRSVSMLLILLCLGAVAYGADAGPVVKKDCAPFPQPDAGYVTDNADLLTDAEEEQIEQWLWDVEEKHGVELAVVTVFSIKDYEGTPNESIEAFARGLFDKYGVGNLSGNDGILLLVALKDRAVRVELGAGYGLPRDADAATIVDDVILPRFKEHEYADGIAEGVRALALEFAGVTLDGGPVSRSSGGWRKQVWRTLLMAGIAVLVVTVVVSLIRNGKRGWGWVIAGMLIVVVLVLVHTLWKVLQHLPESSNRSRGGSGSWSPGGFGGGFGGGFSGGDGPLVR